MTTLTPATATGADEWHVDALDLDAYLHRIGHRPTPPSAQALRSLHEAHVRSIPFENIDVLLDAHPGLELASIADRLVRRRRGGYCYEHALLLAAALERLGYQVRRRMARVQPHGSGVRTHMMLAVRLDDGAEYLADPGFGAGVTYPMPLRDGAVVDQAGWEHRITWEEGLWTLAKRDGDGWEVLHASEELAARPIDYEAAHHYVATHPHSPFSGQLVVMRLDHGVSRRLVGDELTVEHADGRTERTTVAPERLGSVLRELDVELEPEELAALLDRPH